MPTRPSPPLIRAVLTGDIVKSSDLPPEARRRLPEMIRQVGNDLRKSWPQAVPAAPSVFRGDSWQLLISEPVRAIRAALFFRAGVIASARAEALDTRISLVIGPVDFVPAKATEGDGPAYRASGRGLDEMKASNRLNLLDLTGTLPALPVVAPLFDAIMQDWTARQAQAVQGRLRGWNQSTIIERFQPQPITQQSVAAHLGAAHWEAIESALNALESDWPAAPNS